MSQPQNQSAEKEEEFLDDEEEYSEGEGELDYDEDEEEDGEEFPKEPQPVDDWEFHVRQPIQMPPQLPPPQPVPQKPQPEPQQNPPPTEEKPKKKLMKLNPNAVAFVPGGASGSAQPQPQGMGFQPTNNFAGGFQPGFQPNQYDMNFYQRGQFQQQFNPGYGGGFPGQGQPWSGPQFNQNDFPGLPQGPAFQYNQPGMSFNQDAGIASFSRKPQPNEEEEEGEDKMPMDKELLKELRKEKKKAKKASEKVDPSKAKEKPKAPREYKRLAKKDDPKPAEPKKKPAKVEEEVDVSKFTEVDETRSPVNIVFIGHVDAGKSTICGSILLITGRVDKNELRKLEMEAKEKKRESWYLAYIMDINEEERAKGKTVEVGKAHFTTKTKRFTILDAPGHKNYVPNMIAGASQADYAALVISAKTGEFESGFEKGGQTREHAMLAKSLGVLRMVVIINKMDEDNWSKSRFDYIKEQLSPFLANSCGFDLEKDVFWVPISGLNGHNLQDPVPKEICTWYQGPTFFDIVEGLPLPERKAEGALRVPVLDKMRDQGLNLFGKVESGVLYTDMTVSLMPFKKEFQISHIFNTEDQRVKYAKPGENVRLKVKNIEEVDIKRGYMICLNDNLCPVCFEFEAKITILELPEHKPIFSQGYKAIIHMHTIVEEIDTKEVLAVIDKQTGKQMKSHFLKNGVTGIARLQASSYLCIEKTDVNSHLGRFTLRDEGRTIALGEVLKIKVVKGVVNPTNVLVGSEKKIVEPGSEKKPEEEKLDDVKGKTVEGEK